MSPALLFFAFMIGHVVCDYPLQGDFLSRAKNHKQPIPGVPFYQALGAHALMHGGAVWLLTGLWWLGVIEIAMHSFIDYLKCDGRIGFNVDQSLHTACKILYVLVVIFWHG
jgi:hypothetical protein